MNTEKKYAIYLLIGVVLVGMLAVISWRYIDQQTVIDHSVESADHQHTETGEHVINAESEGGIPEAEVVPLDPEAIFSQDDVVLTEITNPLPFGSLVYDFIEGEKDAQVIVINSTDPDCDLCTRYHNRTRVNLQDRFTGQSVGFVQRLWPQDEPITEVVHEYGYEKAQLAYCTGLINGGDAYYNYLDTLFADIEMTTDQARVIAVEQGLSEAVIDVCTTDRDMAKALQETAENNINNDIHGVPNAVIYNTVDGKAYQLLHDEISISQAINRLLRENQN